jgi:hypothetical protein
VGGCALKRSTFRLPRSQKNQKKTAQENKKGRVFYVKNSKN